MNKMNSINKLKYNMLIIGISNLGSKAISFILAPLYSYYLSTEQYGIMELVTSTVGLLLPFICLDIYEATFRFASDEHYDKDMVFSNTLIIGVLFAIIVLLLSFGGGIFLNIPSIFYMCILFAMLDAVYQNLAQYARGIGQVKSFALSGVLNSVVMLVLNVLFLIVLNQGLTGWIWSFLGAKIFTVIYLLFDLKICTIFSFKYINAKFIKEALAFCIPLMPSASMWWIMNTSDRYVISFFVNVSATGVYAVANKLPSLLSVFENVFYQAWQTSAIEIKDNTNRDSLFSNTFFNYFKFLTVGIITLLVFIKPLLFKLFADEYYSAWICLPILLIAVMVHALAGNLGTLYTVFKDTKGALRTSAIGAITNIILNLIFVWLYGMNAAAFTTLVSYLVILLIRWKDSKKFVILHLNSKVVGAYIILILVQLFLYYMPGIFALLLRIGMALIVIWMNREELLKMMKKS